MQMIYRAAAAGGDGMEFVISDGSLDRHGTRLNPNGWKLDSFNRNPIALFGHSGGFPIGRWENVRVVKNQLIGKLVMAAEGTSDRIDELRKLLEQGILRAVSVGFSVLKYGEPGKSAFDFEEQELMEVSLVSIPSNTNAIAKARSMNISESTISLAFGEHAEAGPGDVRSGEHAAKPSPSLKGTNMKTLAQRIIDAQNDLTAKKDRLSDLTSVENLDETAIGELTTQIGSLEKTVETLKGAEAKIGTEARSVGAGTPLPAQARKPLGHQEKSGMDLLVRAAVVRGVSQFGGLSLDQALEQRYPGHEAVGILARADQTLGTTTGSHWADDLVQTAYFGFLEALIGHSVFPDLLGKGLSLTFDRWGTLTLPRRTAGTAGGGFVAEGSPIRVGKITTAAASLVPKKMGVIVAFSKELAKRSTPAIEGIVRQAIIEDTAATLDPILLDATAVSGSRPAGLLNGVSAVGSGFAGGDYQAVREDFKALLAPFYTANGASNIVVLMNPAQGLNMSLMEGPVGDPNWLQRIKDRVTIIESTNVTANRLIAIRASDFAGAGGNPEFDVSEQATIHMEDTTPLEIVSGTGPTTADPVRSLWQTASVGVRMLMDVSWVMRRTGMVQWIDTTTW